MGRVGGRRAHRRRHRIHEDEVMSGRLETVAFLLLGIALGYYAVKHVRTLGAVA